MKVSASESHLLAEKRLENHPVSELILVNRISFPGRFVNPAELKSYQLLFDVGLQ